MSETNESKGDTDAPMQDDSDSQESKNTRLSFQKQAKKLQSLPDEDKEALKATMKEAGWKKFEGIVSLLDTLAEVCEADFMLLFISDLRRVVHYRQDGAVSAIIHNGIVDMVTMLVRFVASTKNLDKTTGENVTEATLEALHADVQSSFKIIASDIERVLIEQGNSELRRFELRYND
jgi:hypothetical protein